MGVSSDRAIGIAWLVILLWPYWSPTLNYIRWRDRRRLDRAAEQLLDRLEDGTFVMHRPSKHWEQDAPYPEVFEEDDL